MSPSQVFMTAIWSCFGHATGYLLSKKKKKLCNCLLDKNQNVPLRVCTVCSDCQCVVSNVQCLLSIGSQSENAELINIVTQIHRNAEVLCAIFYNSHLFIIQRFFFSRQTRNGECFVYWKKLNQQCGTITVWKIIIHTFPYEWFQYVCWSH